MRWRKIGEDEVMIVVNEPESVEDTQRDRKNAFKKVRERSLKVTYKDDGEKKVIITAIVK